MEILQNILSNQAVVTFILFVFTIGIPISLVYISKILREKNIVSVDDLLFAIQALGTTEDIISELGLKNETQIKSIINIVLNSLNFIIQNYKDATKIEEESIDYAYSLCTSLGLELTDARKNIITKIINILVTGKYADKIANLGK